MSDSGTRAATAIAALLYLTLALLDLRPILDAPDRLLPYPELLNHQRGLLVDHADQAFVVWATARNARVLTRRPLALLGDGQCYPLARPHTLGEHVFGEGLLAAPVSALGGGAILAYNAALLLTLWIPALAMYALSLYWTGSAAAAFVAGLLFAAQPARIVDPSHPFVHGDLWTPLVLLFAHRLFAERRWRDALGLVAFAALELLESFYQVIGMALLLLVYGATLAVRYRRSLLALVPKLAFVAAALSAWAAVIFAPYLRTRELWGVLQGRKAMALPVAEFLLPGRHAFPGVVLATLAALALLDRLRGPRVRRGYDPRVVYLCAGLFVVWSVVWGVRVPFTRVWLPSPLLLARSVVPGLDAVRALPIVRIAFYLVLAFLAGYGVLALTERLGRAGRLLAAAAIAVAAILEVAQPEIAAWSFGTNLDLVAYEARPSDAELELLARLPAGAVLDLPHELRTRAIFVDKPHYLLAAAYHGRPIAACYNSFTTALEQELAALSRPLTPDSLDALYALGFRSIVVHGELLEPGEGARLAPLLEDGSRLVEIGASGNHRAFRLASPHPVEESFAPLAAGAAPSRGGG